MTIKVWECRWQLWMESKLINLSLISTQVENWYFNSRKLAGLVYVEQETQTTQEKCSDSQLVFLKRD